MLSECKKMFRNQANFLGKFWKRLSISELVFLYLKYKGKNELKAEAYLSGVIYKLLSTARAYYSSQDSSYISDEDYYDVVIKSVEYVFDKKVWEDEGSVLYRNKNAPEIVLKQRIKTQLINEYYSKQRLKRKATSTSSSLDELELNFSDGYFTHYKDLELDTFLFVRLLIRDYFKKKEYDSAFIIDSIVTLNAFVQTDTSFGFSIRKLKLLLGKLDTNYCRIFAENYGLSEFDVENGLRSINSDDIEDSVRRLFGKLRRDKEFKSVLRDAY